MLSSTHRQPMAVKTFLTPREFGLLLIQLIALTLLVWQWNLEAGHRLPAAMLFVLAGFSIHAWLPFAWRKLWFLALTLGCLTFVVGPIQATIAVLVGLALIAVALAPIPFYLRVFLLILAGGGLIIVRSHSQDLFWPILGSMFMFRLLIFLFSIRNENVPTGIFPALPYFFLLPNVFFPFFPVVDYKTFHQTYYNDGRLRIYQTGVHWMVIGASHLLLYRIIKSEFLPAPLEIRSTSELAIFLAMNYALYIRVSGQFHMICGMLHLFGFNLPRTHHHYFLASSFSDIWRRINIYWKDFMKKLFFYPAFFALRKYGALNAMLLAVLWVFIWTWLAHSWQVFWLLGSFPIQWNDAMLWLTAGIAVAASTMLEFRRKVPAVDDQSTFRWGQAIVHTLKVVGVFSCVSLFWAKWSLPSDLFHFMLVSRTLIAFTVHDIAILSGVLAIVVIGGSYAQFWLHHLRTGPEVINAQNSSTELPRSVFERSATWHLLPMIVLLIFSQKEIYSQLGMPVSQLVTRLQSNQINVVDSTDFIDGYYEQLNEGTLQARVFMDSEETTRGLRGGRFSAMTRPRRDLMEMELIPGWSGEFMGESITVNRWGMRDQERSLKKESGTFRIALVGSSPVMGYGVSDENTFARRLEEQLNQEIADNENRYEVLNFGVGRYYPIHRRLQIELNVLSFDPDLILYFAHQDELLHVSIWPAMAVMENVRLDDPCLENVIQQSGIHKTDTEYAIRHKMEAVADKILACTYQRIAKVCNHAPVDFLYVYLPIPGEFDITGDPRVVISMAENSDLKTLDLDGWWEDLPIETVVDPDDPLHPNETGHRMIADKLKIILQNRFE